MNTLLDYLTVLILFLLLAAPSLVGYAHERRIDRQLRAAEAPQDPRATSASAGRIRRGISAGDVTRAA